MRKAGEAGLLSEVSLGWDAAGVLELGGRPWVDDDDLARLPTGSVLFVQQSPVRELAADADDRSWRTAYGWHRDMTSEAALLSASGWWPVEPERRLRLRGIVSAVSTLVVTFALIDQREPVLAESGGRVRFNVRSADATDSFGQLLLTVFSGRRMPMRMSSSFVLP